MNVKLIISDPRKSDSKDILLGEGEYLIGRESNCDICIKNTSVSREHAWLIISGQDVAIQDMRSSWGTFIDGIQIMGEVPILAGQSLKIGEVSIDLELHSAEDSGAPAPAPPPPTPLPAAPALLVGPNLAEKRRVAGMKQTKPPQLSFLWRCFNHWCGNLRFWFFVFWGGTQILFIILSFAPANADDGLGDKLAMVIIGPPVLAFSFMFGLSILIFGFVARFTDGLPEEPATEEPATEEVKRQVDSGEIDKPLLGPIASKLVSWTFMGLALSAWVYRILFFGMVIALIVYAISQALK